MKCRTAFGVPFISFDHVSASLQFPNTISFIFLLLENLWLRAEAFLKTA